MEAEASLPNDGRFMRRAQERLRDAFVTASMSIDDDKMRKTVRRTIVDMEVFCLTVLVAVFILFMTATRDGKKILTDFQEVIDSFADTGNTSDRHAMWVERECSMVGNNGLEKIVRKYQFLLTLLPV